MKKFSLLLILLSMCLLAGCQKTPEEVKNRIDQYGKGNQGKEDSTEQEEQVSLSDALKRMQEDIHTEAENLILPETIDTPAISEISLLKLQYAQDFLSQKGAICKLWDVTSDRQWLDITSVLQGEKMVYSQNEKEKLYMAVGENGFSSMLRHNAYTVNMQGVIPNNGTIISMEQKEDLQKEIPFKDQPKDVQTVAAYVTDWMQDHWKTWEPDFSYQVKTGLIRQLDDKQEFISFSLQPYYNDVPITVNGGRAGEGNDQDKLVSTSAGISVALFSGNSIDYFTNGTGSLCLKSAEAVDKVISLKGAIKLVENKLSSFKKIEISDVIIQYDLFPEYDYSLDSNKKWNAAMPGGTVNARPVYSFVIENKNPIFEDLGVNESAMYSYIDVDMLDGTLYYDLDKLNYVGE